MNVAAVPASLRLDVTPIQARSASDGTPCIWARPVCMVDGIRCYAESPDSRRGLL